MISQVESFPHPDKQGTPEEGRRIQQLKCCVTTKNNKYEEKSSKNHTQNIALISKIQTDHIYGILVSEVFNTFKLLERCLINTVDIIPNWTFIFMSAKLAKLNLYLFFSNI